jgi:acetyl esterase/lipase
VEERHLARRDGGDIRVVFFEPESREASTGAILWLHGGGLVLGVPEQSNKLASRLALDLGTVVAAPAYRLAPEDPYPAGLDDCVDTLQWLHDHHADLGIDTTRIAVGGDSAGGGLAAAVSQRVLDEGGPPIAFQALVYPMLDDRSTLRADDEGRGRFMWSARDNAYAWRSYLGHPLEEEETRPHVAPARREDLRGLPPAWIGVGDLDLFYNENLDYARRLKLAGVQCELEVVPGMYHAADNFAHESPAIGAFHASLIAALRRAIRSNRP